MKVYCVQCGDDVECGVSLQAIYSNMGEANSHAAIIMGETRWGDHVWGETKAQGNEVKRWKLGTSFDIVVITEHDVYQPTAEIAQSGRSQESK